jgi:hypothetical protein
VVPDVIVVGAGAIGTSASAWAGSRPGTPDGMPIIDHPGELPLEAFDLGRFLVRAA